MYYSIRMLLGVMNDTILQSVMLAGTLRNNNTGHLQYAI